MPTMSIRAEACLPKSGPAVTGPGDIAGASSLDETRMPLCVKEGNADLFCFPAEGSKTEVSTRNDPGRPLKLADGGVGLMPLGLLPP